MLVAMISGIRVVSRVDGIGSDFTIKIYSDVLSIGN